MTRPRVPPAAEDVLAELSLVSVLPSWHKSPLAICRDKEEAHVTHTPTETADIGTISYTYRVNEA